MPNPVLIELTRGRLTESVHRGALVLAGPDGRTAAALGDISRPIFPRSAIKPLQAIPLIETGAADRFGLGVPEIAIACGSHSGSPRHVRLVEAMLAGAGLAPHNLACGAHEPMDAGTARELIRGGAQPSALHHNCSGKHAAMLATAAHKAEPIEGYWRPDHPVQLRIAQALVDLSGCELGPEVRGIDGCSVPNWAIPLRDLARAFARLATGSRLPPGLTEACRLIREACWAEPELVAGAGRLDTLAMQKAPARVLIKAGAEGVYGGAFPELGLGFALKIDDGTKRAADAVAAHLIGRLCPEASALGPDPRLTNWRGVEVGEMRVSEALAALPLKKAIGNGQ